LSISFTGKDKGMQFYKRISKS